MKNVLSGSRRRKPEAVGPSRINPRSNGVLKWVRRANKPSYAGSLGTAIGMIDLFCGCGGLSLGALEAARRARRPLDIRLAVDFDTDAIAVYKRNLPLKNDRCHCQALQTICNGEIGSGLTTQERSLRESLGDIDLLLAGPPCQGHSDLNNSTRRDDPRNRLYLLAARGVELFRPRHAFIENVPGVIHDTSNVIEIARRVMEAAGYTVSMAFAQVHDFGLPQRRRRHLLFASRDCNIEIRSLFPPERPKTEVAVGPFIQDIQDEPERLEDKLYRPGKMTIENRKRVEYLFDNNLHELPDKMRPPCHRDKEHGYRSVYGRMYWSLPSPTITSGFGSMGQGRYIHPSRRRLITPHEALRIQGFPDFFDFSDVSGLTSLRTLIGNAVPPPLMTYLISQLLERKLL
ncbi:MAG: DNA cytosine methyltransferase [Phycisphaerae bacterium]